MSDFFIRPVLVDPAAKFEVADACSAYEATRPGLADAFIDEFEALCRRIEEFPESCRQIEPGVRQALFRRFPYGAIYLVASEAIIIVAVLPTRADPDKRAVRASTRA